MQPRSVSRLILLALEERMTRKLSLLLVAFTIVSAAPSALQASPLLPVGPLATFAAANDAVLVTHRSWHRKKHGNRGRHLGWTRGKHKGWHKH
jgi:hypothetical protein